MKKKLNCLFIGNCQCNGIIHFLKKHNTFNHSFNIKYYENWKLIQNNQSLPIQDIKNADLFIYQPLRKEYNCYSTDPTVEGSIGSFVKNDCVTVTFPYIFSSALWPIIQKAMGSNIWFGGECIKKLLDNGLLLNDILHLYYNNNIDWNYKKRFHDSLSILKNKETITDIKVSPYIEKHIKNRLLFLIPQHPTTEVFLFITNEILKKINYDQICESIINGINDVNLPDSTYQLQTNMHPIHNSLLSEMNYDYDIHYQENSIDFYAQRIIQFINLNT